MIKAYVTLVAMLAVVRLRFERRVEERGMGTLEVVVIAAGLLAAAIFLITVIRAAVDSHASEIH